MAVSDLMRVWQDESSLCLLNARDEVVFVGWAKNIPYRFVDATVTKINGRRIWIEV